MSICSKFTPVACFAQVQVLTDVTRDAAWGVTSKVVALERVVIDMHGAHLHERAIQSV